LASGQQCLQLGRIALPRPVTREINPTTASLPPTHHPRPTPVSLADEKTLAFSFAVIRRPTKILTRYPLERTARLKAVGQRLWLRLHVYKRGHPADNLQTIPLQEGHHFRQGTEAVIVVAFKVLSLP